jgi:hypothetical protein
VLELDQWTPELLLLASFGEGRRQLDDYMRKRLADAMQTAIGRRPGHSLWMQWQGCARTPGYGRRAATTASGLPWTQQRAANGRGGRWGMGGERL